MIDRLFSAALVFLVLAGGTVAMGSALFGLDRPSSDQTSSDRTSTDAPVEIPRVERPRVDLSGQRTPAAMPARSDSDAAWRRPGR
ncbi:MAG: hypothetical protein ABIV63_01555 [Caldimonas sp.]